MDMYRVSRIRNSINFIGIKSTGVFFVHFVLELSFEVRDDITSGSLFFTYYMRDIMNAKYHILTQILGAECQFLTNQ